MEPSETSFRVGDVVRLRSGGPEMTITRYVRSATVSELVAVCAWWGTKGPKTAEFREKTIKVVTS